VSRAERGRPGSCHLFDVRTDDPYWTHKPRIAFLIAVVAVFALLLGEAVALGVLLEPGTISDRRYADFVWYALLIGTSAVFLLVLRSRLQTVPIGHRDEWTAGILFLWFVTYSVASEIL
jgi:hypothetical protein